MNCEKFETIMGDLARGSVMDTAMRAEGLAHTEVCASCAARLADERAVTECLRALVTASENIEAPLRIETALRNAFRQRAATPVSSTRVLTFTPFAFNAKASPRRIAWTAIAAMFLLAIGLTAATRSFYTSHETETANNAKSSNTALPALAALKKEPNDASLQQTTPVDVAGAEKPIIAKESPKLAEHFTTAKVADAGSIIPRVVRRNAHKMRHSLASGADFADTMAIAGENEIATEFLPLADANNLTAQDGGQLVRVELPRSALLAFGLPMNIERADEPVKADVLVGQDGLARAIRFVR